MDIEKKIVTYNQPFLATPGLPEHSVRVSRKARRVILRILPGRGLEVVLPSGAGSACVPGILKRHKEWIESKLAALGMDAADSGPVLPFILHLKGGREEIEFCLKNGPGVAGIKKGEEEKISVPGRGANAFEPERRVVILPHEDQQFVKSYVREWLRREAHSFLAEKLLAMAQQHGFTFASLCIRFQKTRWGSCSCKGKISLNAGLLFLPDPLTEYILAHELCHTRVMSHSREFWKQLFKVDPDALAKDKAMRKAWRYIPAWLYG